MFSLSRFEWCCNVSCQTCHTKQIKITCTNTPSFYNDFDLQGQRS